MKKPKTVEYHRPPTKGEIKFGEGATHYRDFDLKDCTKDSSNDVMKLKKWLKAKDDGLRYYR